MRRGAWATRFGIYFAAIGSAFGLGSLWRFPYIVSANGGGAFVILYFFLMLILGVPLLIGELFIGKFTRRSLLAAQKQLVAQSQSDSMIESKTGSVGESQSNMRPFMRLMPVIAVLGLFCCVVILGYYSVVCGWVLFFLAKFLEAPFGKFPHHFMANNMAEIKASGSLQMTLAVAHIVLAGVIVAKGVEEGIERWVGLIMPVFVGILSVLVLKSLSMNSSIAALRYFMYPDFSKLTITSLGYAVGQLCFTLSIGFGPMITFGSYLRDDALVPETGFRVAVFDALTAVIAGLLIFPLVFSGASHAQGPELLFVTVPQFLMHIKGGGIFGIFFFLCLYLAALGATIAILETVVANVCENSRLTRGKASFFAVMVGVLAAVAPAFSSSVLSVIRIAGHSLFSLIDLTVVNGCVPVVALLLCWVVNHEVNEKAKRDEFFAMGSVSSQILYTHWRFLMKWVVPPLIMLALVLKAVAFFHR